MGYLVILTLTWLNALIGKSKGILLTIFAFCWMAYLGGAASPITTTDYASYKYYYDLLVNGQPGNRMEWLYTYFSELAIAHNFDYALFRLWLVCITFLILFIAVLRLTSNPDLFTALFLIFPLFNEITQIRSFVAYTLVLVGISFLNILNFKRIIVYEFFVFLAIGFHSSAAIFSIIPVIVLLIKKIGLRKVSRISLIITVLFSLILLITSKINIVVNLLANFLTIIGGASVSITFLNLMNNSSNRKFFFLMVLLSYILFTKFIIFLGENVGKSDSDLSLKILPVFSLLFIGEMLIPLLLISDQLQRFQRFGIEGGMVIFSMIILNFGNKKIVSRKYILIVFLFTIFNMFLYYGLFNYDNEFSQSIPYLSHLVKE